MIKEKFSHERFPNREKNEGTDGSFENFPVYDSFHYGVEFAMRSDNKVCQPVNSKSRARE